MAHLVLVKQLDFGRIFEPAVIVIGITASKVLLVSAVSTSLTYPLTEHRNILVMENSSAMISSICYC